MTNHYAEVREDFKKLELFERVAFLAEGSFLTAETAVTTYFKFATDVASGAGRVAGDVVGGVGRAASDVAGGVTRAASDAFSGFRNAVAATPAVEVKQK
jgi:chlorosome envelope protein C